MSLKSSRVKKRDKDGNPTEWYDQIPDVEFQPTMTKQAFKDQTDINKMLKKAQTAGSLAHLQKYPEAIYGQFLGTDFDLLTAHNQIEKANQIFADLPSEVRNEFGNNAISFVKFAGDPANNSKLRELFPAIAAPGSYFPNPVQRGGQGAGAATAPASAPVDPPPEPAPAATEGAEGQ